MFHSLITLKNVQILKGNLNTKLFYMKRVGKWPLFNVQKIFKLSIKDYLLFIYKFMCMIIYFLRILILSFQSHQTRGFGNGLESV